MSLDPANYDPALKYGGQLRGKNTTPSYYPALLIATTNGTTPVTISIGNASGTLGVPFITALDTTAGNITVKNGANTVATIAKGTTAGVMVAATTITSATVAAGAAITVVSSSAGNANVYIPFTAN